jgi:hypothetical protein
MFTSLRIMCGVRSALLPGPGGTFRKVQPQKWSAGKKHSQEFKQKLCCSFAILLLFSRPQIFQDYCHFIKPVSSCGSKHTMPQTFLSWGSLRRQQHEVCFFHYSGILQGSSDGLGIPSGVVDGNSLLC